ALKPSNVLIDIHRRARLADFGFARLSEGRVQPAGPAAAAYLAPEQLRGEPYDARSDVFSFAAMWYEMACGQPAFLRETVGETVDAVTGADPVPVSRVTSRAPRTMDHVLHRALSKDPAKRQAHIGEIKESVVALKTEYETGVRSKGSFFTENWERIMKGVLALVILAAGVAGVVAWVRSRPSEPSVDTDVQRLTAGDGLDSEPSLDARGARVVFTSDRGTDGQLDIWMQETGKREAVRLTRDPADDHEPSISPDGKTVVFRSEREGGGLYTMEARGGATPKRIAPNGRRPRFSADGQQIVYWTPTTGAGGAGIGEQKIFVIDANGGEPRGLQEQFAAAAHPMWSPEGRYILFLGRLDPTEPLDWWLAPAEGGNPIRTGACTTFQKLGLVGEAECPTPGDWKRDQAIFSVRSGEGASLYQIALSEKNTEASTKPTRLTTGGHLELQPASSGDGRFAYSSQTLDAGIWSLPISGAEAKPTGPLRRLTMHRAADLYP
ncbi:MAG: protein kinase domain-containing protein, partial [Bryobacteraceae bacterium]